MSASTIIRPELALESQGLTAVQFEVIDSVSQGNTVRQTADAMDLSRSEVEATKNELLYHFGTTKLAVAVNRAVRGGELAIESRPNNEVKKSLKRSDPAILKFYAEGGSNEILAELMETTPRHIKRYQENLYRKIGAWTQSHAVRRSYELGILAVTAEGWN